VYYRLDEILVDERDADGQAGEGRRNAG